MTIEELLDRKAIEALSGLYMHGLDRLDARAVRAVFHDDASTDYGFFKGGPDDFVAMAMSALKDHAANHHMLGQINLWLDGDSAQGEVYFQAYHRVAGDKGPQDLFIAGRYVDRYEKRNGTWKIAFRSEVNDWTRTEAAADDYFVASPQALRGARMPADPICARVPNPTIS